MDNLYIWKKKLFTNTYLIYSNEKQIGYLKKSYFGKANAEIRGKTYVFKHSWLMQRKYDIIDKSQNRIIGKIKYNSWFNRARIGSNDNTAYWKYDSIFRYKWKVYDARGKKIKYKSLLAKGKITSTTEDDMCLITGLYLAHNYFFTVISICILLFLFLYYFIL